MNFARISCALLAIIASFVGILVANPNPAVEQEAIASSSNLRVLFIGNSFTSYNNMPQLFEGLVRQRTPQVTISSAAKTADGFRLSQFAHDQETLDLISKKGPWDYIVLQEQSAMPLDAAGISSMRESCNYLSKWAASARAKTVLYMTWADSNKLSDQAAISRAYRDIGRDIGAIVIPAGDLFVDVARRDSSINLYDPDNHHPSRYGSYLVACLFRDMLTESKSQINQFRGAAGSGAIANSNERKLERYADDFALYQ